MDRASEFVGRSLYVLESAAIESFRPVDGACRLDATVEVNKTYFAAMFRHMQVGAHKDSSVARRREQDSIGVGSSLMLVTGPHSLTSSCPAVSAVNLLLVMGCLKTPARVVNLSMEGQVQTAACQTTTLCSRFRKLPRQKSFLLHHRHQVSG